MFNRREVVSSALYDPYAKLKCKRARSANTANPFRFIVGEDKPTLLAQCGQALQRNFHRTNLCGRGGGSKKCRTGTQNFDGYHAIQAGKISQSIRIRQQEVFFKTRFN
jgi:hypothetical protein